MLSPALRAVYAAMEFPRMSHSLPSLGISLHWFRMPILLILSLYEV